MANLFERDAGSASQRRVGELEEEAVAGNKTSFPGAGIDKKAGQS